MTATQAKIAGAAALALLAWWLTPKAAAIPRVSRELEVRNNVNDPYFGYTEEEVAAMKAAGARPNPAVDPEMRRLIDASNILIARDDLEVKGDSE